MSTPDAAIQFTLTRDDAKTLLGVLATFKIFSLMDRERTSEEIRRSFAAPELPLKIVSDLMDCMAEEPHRIGFVESTADHLEAWLYENDEGVRRALHAL